MSKKISELTAATTPLAGTELVEIVQGGTSKKVAASYLGGSASGREKLTADRTYYVRTDGSDSNDGLTNTSGGAFLTIQKPIDVFCKTIDCAGYAANIQVGDGTYTVGGAMGQLVGQTKLTFTGNVSTPANVVVSTTSANAFQNYIGGMTLELKSLKVQTTTSGSGIVADAGGSITYDNLVFGACANYHRLAQRGGRIAVNGNYSITGGAQAHEVSGNYGVQQTYSRTITITGTPNFSIAYAYMNTTGTIEDVGNTFSGSATGKRYSISLNSVLNTGGGGANYLPGNTAGDTPTTGAQYV